METAYVSAAELSPGGPVAVTARGDGVVLHHRVVRLKDLDRLRAETDWQGRTCFLRLWDGDELLAQATRTF